METSCRCSLAAMLCVLVASGLGCFVDPIKTAGAPCPCGPGWVCCEGENRCIPEGESCNFDAAGSDSAAAAPDAMPDAVPDAHVIVCDKGAFEDSVAVHSAEVLQLLEGYTSISGELEILECGDCIDLAPLSCLTSVKYALRIEDNENLSSLDGLNNLVSVETMINPIDGSLTGGGLFIRSNASLTSLSGLDKLTGVRMLIVRANPSLTSLEGWGGPTSVEGLLIEANAGLLDLSGLEHITEIADGVGINDNVSLTSLHGLENVTAVVQDSLILRNNPALTDLSALGSITTMGSFLVENNDSLADLDGIGPFTRVAGELAIRGNASLTDLAGLSSVTAVDGAVSIEGNPLLANLTGLGNIDSAWGLIVSDNASLTSLSELSGVSASGYIRVSGNACLGDLAGLGSLSAVQRLSIEGNAELTDLTALGNLTSIDELLVISDNDALPDCEACELLGQLTEGPDTIVVGGNLEDVCTPVPDNCP